MDENKFDWSDSWALLALFAMAAGMKRPEMSDERVLTDCCVPPRTHEPMGFDVVNIDKFAIEQMRVVLMNKKEAEKARLEDEAGYQSLYRHGEDT